MHAHVLALDFDGTIATDGVLAPGIREAIGHARAQGLAVLLVTGRIRGDLERLLCDLSLFDAIVAENGAILYHPESGRSRPLGPPPPPVFLEELGRRAIPYLSGECVVDFDADHAGAVLSVVRDLELPLTLAFNRSRLMVLPQAISKATGLREATRGLRLSCHNAVAIGDAENDFELLAACELGVAVAWGSEALKRAADEILPGTGPVAVGPYIRRLVDGGHIAASRTTRRRVHLGIREGGDPLTLAVQGRNILITGDSGSGKSWVAGLLCEQLVLQHYCVCVIDPEGEYGAIESLPSVVVFDADPAPPELNDVERALRYPDVSVVLDLSSLAHDKKLLYVRHLLRHLHALRRRTGLPHRIVVDEAHYFLHDPDAPRLLDLDLAGYTLVTYRAWDLHEAVLARTAGVIATRTAEPADAEALHTRFGKTTPREDWLATLRDLGRGQAALLPNSEEASGRLLRFRVADRLTRHVRHRRKYVHVPVSAHCAFVFTRDGVPTGQQARTIDEFHAVLSDASTFPDHLARNDFSRWFVEVFADRGLASEVREIESAWLAGETETPHAAIAAAVRARYRAS